MPYLSGVFNTITDLYILLLPLPFIWDLKMRAGRKLRLMAVFSVGILKMISYPNEWTGCLINGLLGA